MQPGSELILRNADRLEQSVLLINPAADGLIGALSARADIRWITQDFSVARQLAHPEPAENYFATWPHASHLSGRHVVLMLPREKARLQLLCKAIAAAADQGQTLWVVGHNRAGIKSAPRVLKDHFTSISKVDAARHCVIWQAEAEAGGESEFSPAEAIRWFEHSVMNHTIRIAWLPGVFSRKGVDEASELLLETLPDLLPGQQECKILDVGCGGGLLGAGAALVAEHSGSSIGQLVLCDSYAPALLASRRTLTENGIKGDVRASDVFSEIDGRFDLILSNPPFHQGVDQDLGVPRRLIQEAGGHLARHGRLVIVANRHLPYQGWMRKIFKQVNLRAENRSFLVIEAREPIRH